MRVAAWNGRTECVGSHRRRVTPDTPPRADRALRFAQRTEGRPEMLNTLDVARYRMADRMREAEAARTANEAAAPHRAAVAATVRRMVATTLALVLWPVKH